MKNKKSPKKESLSRRVFFKNDNIRNEFFSKLKTQFGNWTKLRKHFHIYKSKLERLRCGTYSIKYSIFSDFLKHFNEKDKNFYQQQIILKDKNWGRSKGGISTYKAHKHIFKKGRQIASKRNSLFPRYDLNINVPLTEELCEFIGAFIGEGFTNNYSGMYVIQISGDAKLDYHYFTSFLIPTLKNNFPGINPKIYIYDNTLRLNIYSKRLFEFLTERMGLKRGKKVYVTSIPASIINQPINMVNACIRGIFDTDGTFYMKKNYPAIELNLANRILPPQIFEILQKQGVKCGLHRKAKRLSIQGVERCSRFLDVIGFRNDRHLRKTKLIFK